MISWMSYKDDEKAYQADCKECETQSINSATLRKIPCHRHELEYASQEVTVIQVEFLDPEHPRVGKKYLNDLILDPKSDFEFLLDHIQAEEYEGRTAIVSLTTKKITRDELNTMQEWEP